MAVLPIPPPPQKSKTLGNDDLLFRWLNTVQENITNPTSGVLSFNNRTGTITLSSNDVIIALNYIPSPLSSPAFTGVPTAPTAPYGNNTNQIATTEFVLANTGGHVKQGYGTGGTTNESFFLNSQAVISSFIIQVGYNASSVGPIVITGDATVTVSPGSTWLITGN